MAIHYTAFKGISSAAEAAVPASEATVAASEAARASVKRLRRRALPKIQASTH